MYEKYFKIINGVKSMLAYNKISGTKKPETTSSIDIDKLTCVKINMELKYNLVIKHLEAIHAF